ncbi:MAG: DUF1080 domain-containing protein [Verrucomicrobia bacterium]|nr:DUF1080 domain-containing protein [Verrucomicrobiota bacterium]
MSRPDPRDSRNSGIYFMGRYELQVYDSFGVVKDKYPGIECGGIYPRWTEPRGEFEGHSPRVNASKPPGRWHKSRPGRCRFVAAGFRPRPWAGLGPRGASTRSGSAAD